MEKNVAIRIDGMLMGTRAHLDGVAHYMKNNLSEEKYQKYIILVGSAMGETVDFAEELYKLFPDIVPKELDPDFS